MNKKQLYESIMKNVAREVKKALNEGQLFDDDEQRIVDAPEASNQFYEDPYVIRIKGTDIYVSCGWLTLRSGASWYTKHDWDPIGEAEQRIARQGSQPMNEPHIVANINSKGQDGPKVLDYLKTTKDGRNLSKEIGYGKYTLEEIISRPRLHRFTPVCIPLDYLERVPVDM